MVMIRSGIRRLDRFALHEEASKLSVVSRMGKELLTTKRCRILAGADAGLG
jgi:hypothetical protein